MCMSTIPASCAATTPSMAAEAKRELFSEFTAYAGQVKSAKFTDIRGAIAQAAFELKQRPEADRYIVLFSDMVADYGKTCDTSEVELDLAGIHVVAANVIKSDPADVYLGTAGGASLKAPFNRAELFAQHGLHGLLRAARYPGSGSSIRFRVSPASAGATETAQVSGGTAFRAFRCTEKLGDCVRAKPSPPY